MLARLSCWEQGTEFSWIIIPREGTEIMGMITAMPDRQPWRWQLGYVLAQRFWGRGLMPEAVRAVIDALFAEPGIHRVWAVVDEENYASSRVLEKAGMLREGFLHRWSLHPSLGTVPRDCWSFAIVRP